MDKLTIKSPFFFSFHYIGTILLLISMLWGIPSYAQIQLGPSDDCYIYASGPKAAEPYGIIDPDTLKTRKSVSSDQFTRETYLKFNLEGIDTTFSEALVKLYGIVSENKRMQIYYTDTAWSEESLTGDTRPPGVYISDLQLTAGEGYYSWEVTNYMNLAISQGFSQVAFILKDVAGSVSTVDTRWHSKENASGNTPLLVLTEGQPLVHRVGAYYIDNINGNDLNTAASPGEAWKSLDRIAETTFGPGDSILFKSGGTWQGQLRFLGSGSAGKPILIGKYGNGQLPGIEGQGLVQNTVQFTNQEYLEMQDLQITNLGESVDFRRGVYVQADDMGAVTHIFFRRLEIKDVNGSLEGETSKNNGGIFFDITGSGTPTFFDTLVIEDCYIHDVDRTGISNRSSWSERTFTTDGNWTPSKNVIYRNNTFERTGANALIVRVAFKPLIEHNLFTHCSTKASGNACFSFNTNYATWQYNEACFTQYNSGDEDAGGFDSDYNSKYTIIQYNYSHDNGYGAILLTGGPGDGFNDGTVIRYNVMANNADHVIRTSGGATNSQIYNNTIYSRVGLSNISMVWHKSWEGYSSNTKYYNNIFQAMGSGSSFDLGSSTGNVFDSNIYFGSSFTNEPSDANKIKLNPLLACPDSTGNIADTTIDYSILRYSPCINTGRLITGSPVKDYLGNFVPTYGLPDRGAYEYIGSTGLNESVVKAEIRIFPNPASDIINIEAFSLKSSLVTLNIFTLDGRNVWSKQISSTGNSELRDTLLLQSSGITQGSYIFRLMDGSLISKELLLIVH